MTDAASLASRLANIGIAIRGEQDGLLLLEGTANKRRASVPVAMPDDEAIEEAKRQIASNSGEWPA